MNEQNPGKSMGKICCWIPAPDYIRKSARAVYRFLEFRRRLRKSLEKLDWEIQKAQLEDSTRANNGRPNVDALASNDELRLMIGLHLDGWTWLEIIRHLHGK